MHSLLNSIIRAFRWLWGWENHSYSLIGYCRIGHKLHFGHPIVEREFCPKEWLWCAWPLYGPLHGIKFYSYISKHLVCNSYLEKVYNGYVHKQVILGIIIINSMRHLQCSVMALTQNTLQKKIKNWKALIHPGWFLDMQYFNLYSSLG